jgi:hypothetical protein
MQLLIRIVMSGSFVHVPSPGSLLAPIAYSSFVTPFFGTKVQRWNAWSADAASKQRHPPGARGDTAPARARAERTDGVVIRAG